MSLIRTASLDGQDRETEYLREDVEIVVCEMTTPTSIRTDTSMTSGGMSNKSKIHGLSLRRTNSPRILRPSIVPTSLVGPASRRSERQRPAGRRSHASGFGLGGDERVVSTFMPGTSALPWNVSREESSLPVIRPLFGFASAPLSLLECDDGSRQGSRSR